MPRSMPDRKQFAIPLPVTTAAREAADAFARAQPTAAKAEQVRLNTLAVWVTRDYCQLMDIPSDLDGSDSWNPLLRLTSDVADLRLPDLGQLECRPIREGDGECRVPPEVWDLRIGYVVIEIAADGQRANLLGFTPTVPGETLALDELQPPEAMLDHLYALRQATGAEAAPPVANPAVNLGQWFNGLVDAGWQTVDALLSAGGVPAFSFRGDLGEVPSDSLASGMVADISRAKLIDLAIQLGPQQVVLLVDVQGEAAGSRHIGLQVHPVRSAPYLPPNLELQVLEADGTPFMQAQSRQADSFIQLQFSGQPGEPFRVQIQLQEATYREDFVI